MSKFLDSVEKLATVVGGVLGGPLVPAALEIGKSVLQLIEDAKDVVHEDDVDKLNAIRNELEPKVMAHADKTENMLRGG